MRSRLLVVVLAAVLAIFGVVAVLAYAHQANERAVNGLKPLTVMWATGSIQAGTSLNDARNLLSTEKVPRLSLSTEGVPSITSANEHMVLGVNMAKGQLLLKNMLVKPGTPVASSSGSASSLPPKPGQIEVTMEMCLDADVAGFVQPGSYVAVFDTEATGGNMLYTCTSHQPPSKGTIVTGVVVPSVEVLSVTPASSQGTSSAAGQLTADAPSPAGPVASSGEVLVTLAAPTQKVARQLVALTTAGDPTFGLLTKGSTTTVDPQFTQFPQP
ncbi:MAG TPA: RcpC/CpaB family pilus assembly protein [Streptosporangiaceae bacterium]|nr:RcpC/CpaB family pilus assembly protein [Streptosporangiaceae bacterium]